MNARLGRRAPRSAAWWTATVAAWLPLAACGARTALDAPAARADAAVDATAPLRGADLAGRWRVHTVTTVLWTDPPTDALHGGEDQGELVIDAPADDTVVVRFDDPPVSRVRLGDGGLGAPCADTGHVDDDRVVFALGPWCVGVFESRLTSGVMTFERGHLRWVFDTEGFAELRIGRIHAGSHVELTGERE